MSLEFTDKRDRTVQRTLEHKGKGKLPPNQLVSRKLTQLNSRKMEQREEVCGGEHEFETLRRKGKRGKEENEKNKSLARRL